jgi:nucleotide-binding universal stress UspA family protein
MRLVDVDESRELIVVVGFDGTPPATRALESAAEILRDRSGRLEAVYVAHVPSTVAFSASGVVATREGLDDEEHELASQAKEILSRTDVEWRFQRRDGEVAPELLKASQEQRDAAGPETKVVLVLGGSAHKIDRYLNSTPARVIRQDRFQVVVVP